MTYTTRLIEMLKVLKGSWIGDGIHPSIATSAIIDALEQQAHEINDMRDALAKANALLNQFEEKIVEKGAEIELHVRNCAELGAEVLRLQSEVERLRGIVPEALEKLNDELCAENEALRVEGDRMREALLRLA